MTSLNPAAPITWTSECHSTFPPSQHLPLEIASQVPQAGGGPGPGLTYRKQAQPLLSRGTARDITTSAMLGPGQLPQGWEERGCQTAKMGGWGCGAGRAKHPDVKRGGGAGAEASGRLVATWGLQLGSANQAFSPLPGLRVQMGVGAPGAGVGSMASLLPAPWGLERCHRSQRGGQSFSERWEPGLGEDPYIRTPKPEAEQCLGSHGGGVSGCRSSKGDRGVSDGRSEVGEPGWPVSHPPRTHGRLGEGHSALPQGAPEDLQRPSLKRPSTFANLDASVPRQTAPPPPQRRPVPRGSPSAGRRLRGSAPPHPEAPRGSRAARVSAGVRGPSCPRPRTARRRASPGLRGGRGAGAALEAGRPGIARGPASRSPSPRSVAGPAARCWALERRQGRAQPGPPPPRPSQPDPPLSGPCGRPPAPLFRGAEPALPAWAAMRSARRGGEPGGGAGLALGPPVRRGGGASSSRPRRAGGPGRREGAGCRAAGRGVETPGPGAGAPARSSRAGGRCPGHRGAGQGRAALQPARTPAPSPHPCVSASTLGTKPAVLVPTQV